MVIFMYSCVFKGSVSLYAVADALRVVAMPNIMVRPLPEVLPLVLLVNEYFDGDGNRCYFH